MKRRAARRALQADDDSQGGILMTDEPDEVPQNEPCDPDGDGDDDCNPEGDTDHDYWSEDGRQLQALPGQPLIPVDQGKVVSSLRRPRRGHTHGREDDCPDCPEHRWDGPNVERRWDGQAAMSGCVNSDTPASCFRSICAGRRDGDPSLEATWALPHHDHPGGPPNPGGVSQALARLGSTQGLVNRAAAEAHLKRHQSELGQNSDQNSAPNYGLERRYLPLNVLGLQVETRSDGQARISGYFSVFSQRSQNLGFFVEEVDPGTFRATMAEDDIVALFNHDPNYPLGGNREGRLLLHEDDHGGHMDVRPTSTSYARDLVTNIREGTVRHQSFGFEVKPGGDSWDDSGEVPVRHLRAVRLFDVSPVVFPAYTMTDVQVRQLLERAGLEYRGVCMAVTTAFRGLQLDRIDRRFLTTAIERVPLLRHALSQAAGASATHQPVPQAWSVALANRRAELDAKTSTRRPR